MEDLPVPFLMSGVPYIFHIDANSAFLSWSAAYRVQVLGESLDLRTVPSIVGGDQEKRHGIVLAKSIPAKKYGIQTGEAIVTALEKCKHLIVVPPDYGLYVRASKAMIAIMRRYTDQVIQYSIDEAWCVFDGYERLYGEGQIVELAHEMKDCIYRELGFTVNIGISQNFLLSKMAGDFSKPNKVHTCFPWEVERKMWPLPVSDLFFVGRATTQKLHMLGIYTIGELAAADSQMLQTHLKKAGLMVQRFARGGDLEPYLYRQQEVNKGYGNSTTAPRDVTTFLYGEQILLSLCETIGMRLRADGVKVRVVAIHLTSNTFEHAGTQMQLYSATDVTEEIYDAARQLFHRLWDQQTPIRQLGVHTSKVETGSERQYSLFDAYDYDRLSTVNHMVDRIRQKHGDDAIFRACFLENSISHMSGGLDKERRSGVTVGIDIENEKLEIR